MKAVLKTIGLRELRLALLGAGVAVTAIVVVSIIVPQAKAIRASAASISILEKTAQDSNELNQQLQDKRETIEKLRFRLYGEMANMPIRQVESYIIGRLQRISWNNNIELVGVAPATGERVQIFQEMLFSVELLGRYDDLYRWLREARKDLGFVVIKEFRLSRHDNVDDDPLLVAAVNLATYRAVK